MSRLFKLLITVTTLCNLPYYGLIDEPYSTSPNPRYLYISPTHNLALERTKWTITARRGLAICFGAVGTGKTTIARELAARLEDEPSVSYVYITSPNFPTANQHLRAIIQEFEVGQTSKNYLELLSIFKNTLWHCIGERHFISGSHLPGSPEL